MQLSLVLRISVAAFLGLVQVNAEYIHSVVVFTRHGDRTSKFYKGYQMTNLGSQQVYSSGQFYRERYLDGEKAIVGISKDRVVASQVWASAPDQHVLYQTAVNFLQGLYPPLGESDLAIETLTNGTTVEDPLNGYQFILIHGEGDSDPDTIWIKGDDACPSYTTAIESYKESTEYKTTLESSADFYSQFKDGLGPIMGAENVSYAKAYDVFDLLNVASIHNESIQIDPKDLDQLRYYADEWEWHNNFNATQSERSMGGRTLAGGILQQITDTIDGKAKRKFSLMAGSYDTFLAFFGIANLTTQSPDFMGLPDYASTMAFELITEEEDFNEEKLMVRFLFRNGTDSDQELVAYPLFGGDEIDLPYSSFLEQMSSRAIISLPQWCTSCGSTEDFCVAANATLLESASSESGNSLSNAAAGGIGAGVTLAAMGLIGAAVWLLMRKRRNAPISHVESSPSSIEKRLSQGF